MGGIDSVQEFYKFYIAPGVGHVGPGTFDVPVPQPGGELRPEEVNNALLPLMRQWVKEGVAPDELRGVSDKTNNPERTGFGALTLVRLNT